jgi:hypothetical protein
VKLLEPFTFFVDRSLGRTVVVEALRAAGENVIAHDDQFAQSTPDATWLVAVGKRGWVVLAKDKAVRKNELERRAMVSAQVACFSLGRGDLDGKAMAAAFLAALSRIKNVLRRYNVPIAASVNKSGAVRVIMEGGNWLNPPRDL